MQCAISPECIPSVAKEVLRTASGSDWIQALTGPTSLSAGEIVYSRLKVASDRYRSRFFNDSPVLRIGINQMKLHHHRSLGLLDNVPSGR